MLALLCSGQGTQHREMLRLTENLPVAEPIFAAAARALGADPRKLLQTAGDSALHENRTAQILCVTQALAARTLLSDALLHRLHIVAGYSVGELASWGVTGLLTPAQTIDLSGTRADIMNGASAPDDGLASVRGLARESVERLAQQTQIEIAISNPNDVFIVGGNSLSLREFCEAALAAGAQRAALLPVTVASHTSRLTGAVAPFRAAIAAQHPLRPPAGTILLKGLDGSPVFDIESGMDALAQQLNSPIDWSACLAAAVERGATLFLELGPGRALAEMARAAHPCIPARSLEDFRTAEGVLTWINLSGGR